MSKIIVYEQDNPGIDYEILTKQCAELSFKDGKVKYFSISTQWGTADTIEDALRNILEADEKYDGKVPSAYILGEYKEEILDKFNNIPLENLIFPDDLMKAMEAAKENWMKIYEINKGANLYGNECE